MAEQVESDRRGARYSALLLVVTGIALAGCVALAVGVTVRLVDVAPPRVSAQLSQLPDAAPNGTGHSLADTPATLASELAAEDTAKLAAQRSSRQQVSRSRVRHSTPPADGVPDVTPSPTPTPPSYPNSARPDPDSPDNPRFQPREGSHP